MKSLLNWFKKSPRTRKSSRRSTCRPRFEILENRITPTIYTVNTLADGAPAVDGLLTLREAVMAASSNAAVGDAAAGEAANEDFILFDDSLGGATLRLNQAVLGARNFLEIDGGGGDLSIVGPAAGLTLLPSSDRAFVVTAGASFIVLNNLTLTGGNVATRTDGDVLGGAIANSGGNLTLSNVTVTNNFSGGGGGIASFGSGAILTVNNSVITQNTAFNTIFGNVGGGGIANFASGATLNVTNSVISDNFTENGGGGIENGNGNTANIFGSTVVHNRSGTDAFGGGIRNLGSMTITSSTISQNLAPGPNTAGGGIFNAGSQLLLINSTVAFNISEGAGGGIAQNNFLGLDPAPFLALINTTVANNTSIGGGGGGITVANGSMSVALVNTTITGNFDASFVSTDTGGIVVGAGNTFVMANTIVAQNRLRFPAANTSPDIRGHVSGPSVNNFIGIADASLTGITDFVAGNRIGIFASPLDPKLGALTDNGNANLNSPATLLTRMPLPGSPVIDMGDSTEPNNQGLQIDAIGGKRFLDGNADGTVSPDIGAVEFVPPSLPVVVAPLSGRAPEVRVFQDGAPVYSFLAYAPTFKGGVRVAVGDVNGDGVADIVTASGKGIATEIRVFDGKTRALINSFTPYGAAFKKGAFVSVGQVTAGGPAEIIISPEKGVAPVLVTDRFGVVASSFLPYGPKHAAGIRVAVGDVTGDGNVEIVTLNRSKGQVGVFDGAGNNISFFSTLAGNDGSVAVGNIDGLGKAEIFVGAGKGRIGSVQIFNGNGGQAAATVTPFGNAFKGGVDVAAVDLDGDGIAELVAGRRSTTSQVRVLDMLFAHLFRDDFTAFESKFTKGILVAG